VNLPSSLSFGEFARQLREMRKLGPITRLLKRLPKPVAELAEGIDEEQITAELDNVELIAAVMTPGELEDPAFLPDDDRTRELASRAEVEVQECQDLFEQIDAARRFLSGEESGEEPPPFTAGF
jgi:signal recognition particle GTPase